MKSLSPREKREKTSNKFSTNKSDYELDSLIESKTLTPRDKNSPSFQTFKAIHKPTSETVVLVVIRNVSGYNKEDINLRQKYCQQTVFIFLLYFFFNFFNFFIYLILFIFYLFF